MSSDRILYATYVESGQDLHNVCRMTESIRTFGGNYSDGPILALMPDHLPLDDRALVDKTESFGIEIRRFHTPEQARWLYYGGKPFAAAEAEKAAEGLAESLVWIDEDTVVIAEPVDFELKPGKSLAWVPVMHNRSGTLWDGPPDDFWARIYERLSVTDDMLFPMVTPADEQKIRAYFHCGLLVVRPGKGIMRRWAADFEKLYSDQVLVDMCKADTTKKVFLHQTALTGSVVHTVGRDEMVELDARYNYPIFFEKGYEANRPFDSIDDIITVRCVVSTEKMGEDWHKKLSGASDKIAWLKDRL
ncbi:MAG: hypothetical protein JSU74_00875 [Candidatus Zixiibacteriota bacterium]|nr:MAG: hypothetical protein JSU74_00875 [candidate division Zixibacteria bacterium]